MSRHLDDLEALLNRALTMPGQVDVTCTCGPYGHGKQLADHDPDGDHSTTGKFPYRCQGCGARFDLYGGKSPLPL